MRYRAAAIYGIGRPRAKAICAAAGVAPTTKIKDLTDAQMDKLREQVGSSRSRATSAAK